MALSVPTTELSILLLGILDGSPNGVVAYQPIRNEAGEAIDYRTVYYNAQAQKLLGYSETDFSHKTLFERFPEGRTYKEKYMPLIQQNQPFVYESFFIQAQCWLEIQARRLDDGFFMILRDITDRKEAEHQLQQSASMLQNVLDGVQSGIVSYKCVRDEAGHIIDFELLSANHQASQILKKSVDQLIGQRILTLFPAKRTNGMFDRYVTVVESGQKQQIEQEFIEDGRNVWLDVTAIRQNDGLVLTLLDISERRQAQLDLDRQTDHLTAIFESSLNGIIAMKAIRNSEGQPVDFLIEVANSTTSVITGRASADIVGTRLMTAFPGSADAGFLAVYLRVVITGQAEQATQYYQDQHGLEAWFEVSAVRQGTERVVVTFSDVTSAQRIQQQLRESNQSLEQFAGVASHDLQEPLRKVQSFGNVLAQQYGPQLGESGQDLIRRMQSAADRMSTLIRDLLAYSRLTSQPETSASVDMNVLVAEVLTDLETQVTDKKALIKVEALPVLMGNALTLRQLMQNLIGNALKFARPNVAPHIRIHAEQVRGKQIPTSLSATITTDYWAIQVSDNGIGFDDRYKDRIFGAFQRLHNRSSPYPGTGIGLAIVKKVVEQHHGLISAQSKVGEGSAFTVYLPV